MPEHHPLQHTDSYTRALDLFSHTLGHSQFKRKPDVNAGMLALADRPGIERANALVSEALANAEKVWMTSDLHLNHGNIIGYCDRPYGSSESMNQALLALLAKVEPQDLLVLVGDLAMGEFEAGLELIKQIPGRKILVLGNHDLDRSGRCRLLNQQGLGGRALFEAIVPFLFWPGPAGRDVVVTHYPLSIPDTFRGAPILNYHGHLHRTVLPTTDQVKYMNVGWDVNYSLNCV